MDDSFSSENGQEICTNDGILLKKGPAEFLCEIKNKVTGTLALVHYLKQNTYCIEWKTNDILIADADALEQDEWSFVDTVKKRQRTASETLIFNTSAASTINTTNTQTSSPILHQQQQNQFTSLSAATAAATILPSSVNNSITNTNTTANTKCSVLRVQIYRLKCIEVIKNGHIIKLINRFDGKTHSEYFFQNGNADGFVRSLQHMRCLQRSQHDRFCYEIIDNIEEFDKEKIQKTFAELNINDIKNSKIGREDVGGIRWISGIVRPLGHTIDFLTKMSDTYGVIPNVPAGDITTTRTTTTATDEQSINDQTYPRQISPSSYTEDAFNSSYGGSTDEYEVLGTSPKQNDINQHNNNKNNNNNNNHKNNSNNMNNNGISFKELNKQDSMMNDDDVIIKLPIRPEILRGNPLTMKQWKEFFSEDGYVTDIERVKEIIFHGGIEMNGRSDVWKYLLNYYQWNHSEQQREQYQKQKTKEYFKMKLQWLSMNEIQEKNFSDYRDRKCQIEKDVKRTDRTNDFFSGDDNPNLILLQDILMTYVMYNFDLGYVQGMSDLLAPLLYIVGDEADTFWCFVGFMDIVFNNFDIDQSGMKQQLMNLNKLLSIANPKLLTYFKGHGSENMYFCFRWLLVWFKREFSIVDIMELWECLWTGLPCKNFHLFISVAILDEQMDIFIDNNYEFNEILKHVNELSLKINLKSTLEKAESIYLQIKNAIDNNNNNNNSNSNSNNNTNNNNNNNENNDNNNSNNEINNYNNNYFMIKEEQLIELNNIRIIIGEEPVYNKLKKRNLKNSTIYSNNDDKNHHRYIASDDLNDDDDDDIDDDDDDDNFDDIQILRNFKDEEIYQQKLDEACEKSMYGSYF